MIERFHESTSARLNSAMVALTVGVLTTLSSTVGAQAADAWSIVELGTDMTSTSVTLPWSEDYFAPDGEIPVRAIVTSDFRGRWGYAIDEIVVNVLD